MRVLVISDFHFTEKFSKKQFEFYSELFASVDKIIINGDLWEGLGYYKIKFDAFINSSWNKLFPILKSKDCVYVYGNHDKFDLNPKDYPNEKTNLFSSLQADEYKFTLNNKKYKVIHGCQMRKSSLKINKNLDNFIYIASRLLSYTFLGTLIYKVIGNKWNNQILRYQSGNLPKDETLICGDTHSPYYSERYINTGFNFSNNFGYAIIDEKGVKLETGRI